MTENLSFKSNNFVLFETKTVGAKKAEGFS